MPHWVRLKTPRHAADRETGDTPEIRCSDLAQTLDEFDRLGRAGYADDSAV